MSSAFLESGRRAPWSCHRCSSTARDGEALAYRFHDAASERILIFIHGSSYHGGGYDELATYVSAAGAAKVVLPYLRGHYFSGRRRGDIEYIGQCEDDIVDLIRELRKQGHKGPIILGGYSSGGGFVLRFAGGDGPKLEAIAGYIALAPIIPRTAAVRGGNAGGWNVINLPRILGLVTLNFIGVRGFDGLPIIAFNKPASAWDGTETLAYSWRLNVTYHPRNDYASDVKAMPSSSLVLVGDSDEAVDSAALLGLLKGAGYRGGAEVLAQTTHFGIFHNAEALKRTADFVAGVHER
ncbi:alpha/beta fold hydrolase [Kaistia dalseonensis]|uniref:Pimeloyl-ACP methyl ester carboxylesterase n=1 Tax=Kaistia dalseonensis TaxID=410840 RepID=A0ABU0HC28_9HYPH|nr:alpha/beta fold hydrolase [Kaistia dalseonensis]MCX5497233.1 alpha/beta fold hydrolase [Kaistia dalseonensis]MDQ0439865.1 pimeloyl-ACP methyl ester carboxylesterase [Kaistia dalseonensis]